jgi:hypothetical protein
MRMLLDITLPNEEFNNAVREGTAGATISRILKDAKPEAVYFTEREGKRGAVLIVDVAEPSKVPSFAEPWFLQFNADVQLRIVMSPEELQRSGLEALGRRWADQPAGVA